MSHRMSHNLGLSDWIQAVWWQGYTMKVILCPSHGIHAVRRRALCICPIRDDAKLNHLVKVYTMYFDTWLDLPKHCAGLSHQLSQIIKC